MKILEAHPGRIVQQTVAIQVLDENFGPQRTC